MAFQATTGLGTPTQINVPGNEVPASTTPGYNTVTLSLTNATWPSTFQLEPEIVDASGAIQGAGTAYVLASAAAGSPAPYTLTAVAASSGQPGVAAYTGTITSGGSNAYVGREFIVTGFVGANNNGTFQCTASTALVLTLSNANATAETHAGVAQDQTATTTYTGTFTAATTGSLVGQIFTVAGFVTHTSNNGTFICTANTNATTATLANPNGLSETHAATATAEETAIPVYVAYSAYAGASEACITVSAGGLITAAYKGAGVVEVSYPTFNNSIGNISSSGNIMNGLPIMKIYSEVNCYVVA